MGRRSVLSLSFEKEEGEPLFSVLPLASISGVIIEDTDDGEVLKQPAPSSSSGITYLDRRSVLNLSFEQEKTSSSLLSSLWDLA